MRVSIVIKDLEIFWPDIAMDLAPLHATNGINILYFAAFRELG
jgi:hypothetical protein